MPKKHKHTRKSRRKQLRFVRVGPLVAVFGLGLLGLGAQMHANLAARHKDFTHQSAVAFLTPAPTKRPAPTATPAPPPPPTAPKPVSHRVAYTGRPVPAVKPAPASSVDHLVPVAQPPATSTPTPEPGKGSGPSTPPVYAYTSTNWSGYLASVGKFTAASGSWAVPSVTGNGHAVSADAAWIGIGGVTSGDLIQVGTTEFVAPNGQVSYSAFYEMLPAPETPIPGMTVGPGDEISAEVKETSPGHWHITLADETRSENFAIDVTYASSYSTAEWIQEDPSYASGGLVPFDHFGAIHFAASKATADGANQTLAALGAQAIILVSSGGTPLATPSAVGADGQSFSVTSW